MGQRKGQEVVARVSRYCKFCFPLSLSPAYHLTPKRCSDTYWQRTGSVRLRSPASGHVECMALGAYLSMPHCPLPLLDLRRSCSPIVQLQPHQSSQSFGYSCCFFPCIWRDASRPTSTTQALHLWRMAPEGKPFLPTDDASCWSCVALLRLLLPSSSDNLSSATMRADLRSSFSLPTQRLTSRSYLSAPLVAPEQYNAASETNPSSHLTVVKSVVTVRLHAGTMRVVTWKKDLRLVACMC